MAGELDLSHRIIVKHNHHMQCGTMNYNIDRFEYQYVMVNQIGKTHDSLILQDEIDQDP